MITGRKVEPNPHMSNRRNTVSLYLFLEDSCLIGKRIVRGADRGAGKGKAEKAKAAL